MPLNVWGYLLLAAMVIFTFASVAERKSEKKQFVFFLLAMAAIAGAFTCFILA